MNVASLNNRLAILDGYAAQGLTLRLCPDTQAIQWRGTACLEDWRAEHLRTYKAGFTEALRFRAGLCLQCGLDAAKLPTSRGRRQVFDAVTGLAVVEPYPQGTKAFGPFRAVWEECDAPEEIKARLLPPLFCQSCYDAGAYYSFCWGFPRGGARADAKSKDGGGDALFEDIDREDADGDPEAQVLLF